MERALLALCALALNAVLGGPRRLYAWLGLDRIARQPAKAIRELERKLNREHRSTYELEVRGAVLLAAAVASSIFVGWIGSLLFIHNLRFIELALVASLLPLRPTWDRIAAIRQALEKNNLPAARQAFENTVWRHHAVMDESGVARAAVEMLAVHFSEKIVSPVLWYVVFGLPGFFVCKLVTLMQETFSHSMGGSEFSKATRTCHAFIHYVPSRLAAMLWLAVSLFLPSRLWQTASAPVMTAMAAMHSQPLALLCAGSVLALSLGGPTSPYSAGGWCGTGTARPVPSDIRRAQTLFALLHILFAVLLGLFL